MADRDVPTIVIEQRGGLGPFLWGALVGAAVALYYAPGSGEQTRRDLRANAQRLRDRAEDRVRDMQHNVSGTLNEMREEVGGRMDAARHAMEVGRDAARETRAETDRHGRGAADGGAAGSGGGEGRTS